MNQTLTPQQSCHDDEISLFEFWQILVKRKVSIVLCLIVFTLAGAIYCRLKAPVFDVSCTLRIGQIQAGTLLENPQDLVARFPGVGEGDIKVAVVRGASNLVTVTAFSGTAEGAVAALEAAVHRVIGAHTEIYNQNIQLISERIVQIGVKRQALEQEFNSLDLLVRQLRGRDSVQASLMAMQRTSLMNSILALEAERFGLLQQLQPPQTRPTEVLGHMVAPAHPSQPRTLMILVLAAMLGLIVGVALVFAMEFLAKARGNVKPA